jgi:hypothetical protein
VVLLAVLILSGGASLGAEAVVESRAFSGAGDCPPPSDLTNATLVTRWYEDVVNGQKPEAIDQIVATDVVIHVTTDGTGDEVGIVAAERYLREQLRAYPTSSCGSTPSFTMATSSAPTSPGKGPRWTRPRRVG